MSIDESDGLDEWEGDMISHAVHGSQNDEHDRKNYFNFVHQRGPNEVLKAGDYFVGDLTPMLTESEMSVVSSRLNHHGGYIELDGDRSVVVWPTIVTRGRHLDDSNREYLLGHYLIGTIRLPHKPPHDAEKWKLDQYAKMLSNTRWGQVIHYEEEFSCSCYEGEVPLANSGGSTDQIYEKIRILNFGEQVKFTLYEYNTVEGMHLRQKNTQ